MQQWKRLASGAAVIAAGLAAVVLFKRRRAAQAEVLVAVVPSGAPQCQRWCDAVSLVPRSAGALPPAVVLECLEAVAAQRDTVSSGLLRAMAALVGTPALADSSPSVIAVLLAAAPRTDSDARDFGRCACALINDDPALASPSALLGAYCRAGRVTATSETAACLMQGVHAIVLGDDRRREAFASADGQDFVRCMAAASASPDAARWTLQVIGALLTGGPATRRAVGSPMRDRAASVVEDVFACGIARFATTLAAVEALCETVACIGGAEGLEDGAEGQLITTKSIVGAMADVAPRVTCDKASGDFASWAVAVANAGGKVHLSDRRILGLLERTADRGVTCRSRKTAAEALAALQPL